MNEKLQAAIKKLDRCLFDYSGAMEDNSEREAWEYVKSLLKIEEKEPTKAAIRNPIYIEYYSHEACDCYKIDLPWSAYKQEKMVLGQVSDGYEQARVVAKGVLAEHIHNVLSREDEVEHRE